MNKMKTLLPFVIAAALAATEFTSSAQTTVYSGKSVPANAGIAGAGNGGLPGGSVAPVEFDLPANASVLTMQGVAGTWSLNGGNQHNDPDGVVVSGSGDYPAGILFRSFWGHLRHSTAGSRGAGGCF